MYDDYHKKMANIVNSIQSEEGAEKNQYERETKGKEDEIGRMYRFIIGLIVFLSFILW